MNTLPLALLGAALAAPLFAQTPPRLIGLTNLAPTLVQLDMATCAIPAACPTAFLPPVAMPFAGGSAYDSTRQIVWASNGPLIAATNITTCAVVCPPAPAPVAPGLVVTGLAMNERTRLLFVTDSGNNIGFAPAPCPLVAPMPACPAPIPPGQVIGSCATSDFLNLVFYTSSFWGGGPPASMLFVAPQGAPCAPICMFLVPPACGAMPLGPITGAAFDDSVSVLWLSDGRNQLALTYQAPCNFMPLRCCVHPAPGTFTGLCLVPAQPTRLGGVCSAAPCANCPTMTHRTIGDSVIGNPAFGLVLNNAPSPSVATMLLNFGACTPPGFFSPPLCAPVLVPVAAAPITVGPLATGTGVGCTGNLGLAFAIPFNPVFCGTVFSSQWVVLCNTASGVGTAVSECLSWMISAS